MSVVRIEKPSSPTAETEVMRRLRSWRDVLGKPLAPGRANPDNDLFYLLLDAEEAIEGLRRYARSLEAARALAQKE